MIKKSKLANAIALTLTGAALSLAATSNVSAKSMYNTYNAYPISAPTDKGTLGTDGWVWGGNAANPSNSNAASGWVGTASSTSSPLGYIGSSHLNWAATLGKNETQEISQKNAFDTYGVYADIDTAGGAWLDTSHAFGWRHNTDIGLIQSDTTQRVHLKLSTISPNSEIAAFGLTLFSGMDETNIGYSHHGDWNGSSFYEDNPFYTNPNSDPEGLIHLAHFPNVAWDSNKAYLKAIHGVDVDSESVGTEIVHGNTLHYLSESTDISFIAEAGKIYTVYLGGLLGKDWNQQHDGYKLELTTSPVPVPAAVWLMGSGLIGLISFGRKSNKNG